MSSKTSRAKSSTVEGAADRSLGGGVHLSRSLLLVVGTVVSCLVVDWATFAPLLAPLGITPWNPSIGLCMAIVLRAGLSFAPLLGIAPLLADFFVRDLPFPWLIIATEALITGVVYSAAVWVLTSSRWRIDLGLRSIRDLVTMLIVSTLAAACVSVAYSLVLLAAGQLDWASFVPSALTYCVGDVIGFLVMAPFVLLASGWRTVPRVSFKAVQMLGAIALAIFVAFGLAPEARLQLSYVVFLPIVWIAVRSGLAGVSAGLMVTQIGIMSILHWQGDTRENVAAFQALMMALAGSGLIIGVLTDERERNERHLRQQQNAIARAARIGALGEVTTALAHELNQPLTAAGNYTRAAMLAANETPPDLASARAASRSAFEQVERGAAIVGRFREYIRVGRLDVGAHDVGDLIGECISLLQPEIERSGALIETSIPPGIQRVAVDRLQMAQVLTNLLRNAIESVEEAGRPKPTITVVAEASQSLIEIAVTDNGVGFPAGFTMEPNQPIESTKVDGLGIGLSLCRSIVASHGGQLKIERLDEGASVRIELPAAGASYGQ